MRNTSSRPGWVLLCLVAVGCSIEGTRQRGDECLQDRECVAPLRCEVTPTGSSRCVTPTRLDAGPPVDVVVVVDAGTPPVDAGTPPVDVPPSVDTPSPVDVPPDQGNPAVDAGTPKDVGADAAPD